MTESQTLAIEIVGEVPPAAADDVTAICVFHKGAGGSNVEGEIGRVLEMLVADGDFEGKEGSTLHVRTGGRRLLLVGLGNKNDVDLRSLHRVSATAVRQARETHARRLVFVTPSGHQDRAAIQALAEGAILGSYDNDFYQNDDEEDTTKLEKATIVARLDDPEGAAEALQRARIVADSANWARALADEPGNALTPREFARRAEVMAKEFGLVVESLNADQVRARGMGGLLGVGQGSTNEPALIVIRYDPEGATESDELWAFVGKGITFDTGGISLKKAEGMEEMKSDMAGGAAALAALRAIAQLKPKRRVVAIVPAAENMPSEKSIKPGDVVRTLAGHTIEVVDTDAEGRLVLVDGIAYAKRLGASKIVDLATLTGSIIIALGTHRTGLFSNDDDWAETVQLAAERAGEPVWRMPVSDDYKKKIESMIADFKNYGGKPDATAAALLLSKFAGETPWVHLDIAGTSWYEEAEPFAPKGASGVGVRTLVELICN
jgi:leucyl aminopeptidase